MTRRRLRIAWLKAEIAFRTARVRMLLWARHKLEQW